MTASRILVDISRRPRDASPIPVGIEPFRRGSEWSARLRDIGKGLTRFGCSQSGCKLMRNFVHCVPAVRHGAQVEFLQLHF